MTKRNLANRKKRRIFAECKEEYLRNAANATSKYTPRVYADGTTGQIAMRKLVRQRIKPKRATRFLGLIRRAEPETSNIVYTGKTFSKNTRSVQSNYQIVQY